MEAQKQEIWCTIKEYKRINSWAREVTPRWLRKRAKEGLLLNKVEKVLHPSGKYHTYLINIIDPTEIRFLSSYRKNQEYQKDNPHIFKPDIQAPDPCSKVSDNDDTESALPLRIGIRAPIGSLSGIVLQSKLYRNIFLAHLEDMAVKASIKPGEKVQTRRKLYRLPLKSGTLNYLQSQAEDMDLSVNAAVSFLLMEFLQANQYIIRAAADDVMQAREKKKSINQKALVTSEPQNR
ncbi:MAG: hypothetical protein WCO89_03085 [Syntrophus sp. (in: bacteria)]